MKIVEKLKLNSMLAKLIILIIIGSITIGLIVIFSSSVKNPSSGQIIGNWEVKYGTIPEIDYLNLTFSDDQTFTLIIKNANEEELIYTGTYKMAANNQVVIVPADGKAVSNAINNELSNQAELANGKLLYGDIALIKVKEFSAKKSVEIKPAAANTNPENSCH